MVAYNYGGAYNPAYTPAYSPVGSAPPSSRPGEKPNRYHSSRTYLYKDKFFSDAAKVYVDQSWNFNNGGRGCSIGVGYQYKVKGAGEVSSHNLTLARCYEQAELEKAERQAIYAQAAENDRRRAAGREEMLQKNMAARESQGQAFNPLQFLQPLIKILGMIF